jgi:hypothetical protein
MLLSHPLWKDGTARHYVIAREYRELLEESSGVLNVTWFSDEAYFHLDCYINKQSFRFAVSGNPRLSAANLPHPKRVTVWCALSSIEMFDPAFIDSTVTCDVCLSLLNHDFLSFLMGCVIPVISAWFQRARPHSSNTALHFLHDVLEETVLPNQYPMLFHDG